MNFNNVLTRFVRGFEQPLPGRSAHYLMSPVPIDLGRFNVESLQNYQKGAVLILLYPVGSHTFFPLIKRSEYPGVHSGQIAFPGGKMERSDSNEVDTALREAAEEVGINPKNVRILGRMSDLYIPASNFLVSPIVGYAEFIPNFQSEIREVAKIIPTALDALLSAGSRKRKIIDVNSEFKINTPYFEVDREMVWGATAMILSELIQILADGAPKS